MFKKVATLFIIFLAFNAKMHCSESAPLLNQDSKEKINLLAQQIYNSLKYNYARRDLKSSNVEINGMINELKESIIFKDLFPCSYEYEINDIAKKIIMTTMPMILKQQADENDLVILKNEIQKIKKAHDKSQECCIIL